MEFKTRARSVNKLNPNHIVLHGNTPLTVSGVVEKDGMVRVFFMEYDPVMRWNHYVDYKHTAVVDIRNV